MPSLRDASCCKVDVVNGAGGLRFTRRRSTDATENCPASAAARRQRRGVQIELVELLAIQMGELGGEGRAGGG